MLSCEKHGVEFKYSNDGYDFRGAEIIDLEEFMQEWEIDFLVYLSHYIAEDEQRWIKEIKEVLSKCWMADLNYDIELSSWAQEMLNEYLKPDNFS
tara:strand:- start:8557 stop:8841 length:285 start_codon:yes stop_codon:yes gene_type:complete